MKYLPKVTMILVLIGALNWGLIGLLRLNLVTALFGEGSLLTTVVYLLVGLSAVYIATTTYGGKKQ